jgi:hypothetical protein
LAAAEYDVWPLPLPDAPDVMVIHVVDVDDDQPHVGAEAVTVICPLDAVDSIDWLVAVTLKVHGGGAAAWLTANVCPATVSDPLRGEIAVLAAAAN